MHKVDTRLLLIIWVIWPLCGYGQSPFRVPYRQSPILSNSAGQPLNSSTWYFPAELFVDSTFYRIPVSKEEVNDSMRTNANYEFLPGGWVNKREVVARMDTFRLNWFSYFLYKLGEPVLYNYPLGKEVYRLTWIRSFQPPVIVRMEKDGNHVRLTTKLLSQIPRLPGNRYFGPDGKNHQTDPFDAIPFRINQVKRLSKAFYKEYTRLLMEQHVLFLSPLGFSDASGTDGSEWILETHRPEGYCFITRWSPKETEALRVLGDYLLDLSDAKGEERY